MPIFPTTITANLSTTYPFYSTIGPFEIAGVIYVFLSKTIFVPPGLFPSVVNCYKSTDAGDTWTQVGGDSNTIIDNPSCITAVVVGSIVYVAAPADTAPPPAIQVIAFNTVTETFAPGVVTTNVMQAGPGGFAEIAAAYRPTDGQLVISAVFVGIPSNTRTAYFLYDVVAQTWGPWIPNGFIGVSVDDWGVSSVLRGNGMMHFLFYNTTSGGLYLQALSDANVLGALQLIDPSVFANPMTSSIEGNTLVVGGMLVSDSATCKTFTGASADPVVFTENDLVFPGFFPLALTPSVARSGAVNYLLAGENTEFDYAQDSGSGFGAVTTLLAQQTFQPLVKALILYTWGAVLTVTDLLGNSAIDFWGFNAPVPPPVVAPVIKATAGGGVYFPRFINKTLLHAQIARVVGPVNQIKAYRELAPLSWLYDFPNGNDICLSREWRLYNQIDRTALSCARKPDCFTGENASRPWVEAPSGAVTFNPDKAIPLPDPATVNAVILSFRVPIGFDGILLAQYHAYTGAGVFIEGSGDIVWRVRVNGRYLRDMGNMQVSIGSPQTLSPCPGGLWLHSGNLVEYVVSAPNGSGSLPLPGQGNILAGLHGWFYPRI